MTITTTTTTTPGGFSLGMSSEEKLSLPLDTLIQQTKQQHVKTKKTYTGGKNSMIKNGSKKQNAPQQKSHKQQNVKKTVLVPVSRAARAKASAALASAKRQTVINKRRTGLVLTGKKGKKAVPTVQLRPHKTSAMARKLQKQPPQGKGKGKSAARGGGLDVSNILNHFRSHPKKFDVPKGSNLRITINLNNVKPVVGGHK